MHSQPIILLAECLNHSNSFIQQQINQKNIKKLSKQQMQQYNLILMNLKLIQIKVWDYLESKLTKNHQIVLIKLSQSIINYMKPMHLEEKHYIIQKNIQKLFNLMIMLSNYHLILSICSKKLRPYVLISNQFIIKAMELNDEADSLIKSAQDKLDQENQSSLKQEFQSI